MKEYGDKYKNGHLKRPFWKEVKDESFFLRWAEYIYGMYAANACAIGYGGRVYDRTIDDLRKYGRGVQNPIKYRDYLDPANKKGERMMNINWDTEKILPNLRAAIKELINEISLEPDIEAVDDASVNNKRLEVAKMKMNADPRVKQLMGSVGINSADILPPGVETEIDVETLVQLGGMKLIEEIEIKDLVDKTISEGGWDVVMDMIGDDIVDLHISALHIRNVGNVLRMEYIDPGKLIVPKSKYLDYRDVPFIGFVQSVTIAELRESGVKEEALIEIAKKYTNLNNNRVDNINQNDRGEYIRGNNDKYYDSFSTDVMTFYFYCEDAEKYIVGRHKNGNEIYDKVDIDAELDPKDIKRGKSFNIEKRMRLWKAEWVVGTKCLVCSGVNDNNVLDENNYPLMPIMVISGDGPAPVEKAIPLVDDIHIAIYKMRHLLQRMAPGPRMIIDKSRMRPTVTFGEEKISIREMLSYYPITGTMFYESVGDFVDPTQPSIGSPFTFQETGIAEDVNILLTEIQSKTERLRTVLGVNALMDGSSRQPNMLKGVMEGLINSASTINRPFARLMMMLFRRVVLYVGNFWRNALVYEEGMRYPEEMLERIGKAIYRYQVKFGLTKQDKEVLLQDLSIRRDQGQIGADAFIVIYNYIKRGDIAKAQLYYAKSVRDAKKQAQAEQMQLVQAQTQGNEQAAVRGAEAMAQANKVKTDGDLEKIAAKADADIRVAQETAGIGAN